MIQYFASFMFSAKLIIWVLPKSVICKERPIMEPFVIWMELDHLFWLGCNVAFIKELGEETCFNLLENLFWESSKNGPIWWMGAVYQKHQTGVSMYQSDGSEASMFVASIILMHQSYQRGVIMWPSWFCNELVGGGRFSTCENNIIKESFSTKYP